MKKAIHCMLGVMFVSLALVFFTNMVMAKDTVKASEHVKILLDNEQVRVLKVSRPPGTKVPMHTHPTFLSYYFNSALIKVTLPNGKIIELDIPEGKLTWKPDGAKHAVEVLGTNTLNALVVELKTK